MARTDVVLNAGIKFNPRDIDTKAIKNAIVRVLSTTTIDIKRVRISREAKSALENAIQRTSFRIEKARFGRQGLTALRQQFRQNEFRIDKVEFTNRALSSLNRQLKKTPFQIATASPAAAGSQSTQSGASAATRQQTQNIKSQIDVIKEQRAALLSSTRNFEALIVGTSQAERAQNNFAKTVATGAQNLQGFGANIVKITQRFSAYLVSIRAILAAQQAFAASIDFIFEFDNALQNLVKVVNTAETSIAQLSQGLFQVANQTGNAVTAVAEATGQFVRQGLDVPEALERSRAALIGVNAANISVSDSTKLVTVALRVFGGEINNAVDALDILNITADNAATSQNQIVQGILRSGSAAQAVGLSFGELNAIIAATVEQTQLSGNQIGSALKTIFARLATNTSGLVEQANALGANIQPGEGLLTTLQKLADIFPNLTRGQQAQIVTLAAGKRRFTEFAAILQQLQRDSTGVSRVQELLNIQLNASGNTAAKNEVELQKLSTRAQQTANAFSEFVAELADVGGTGGIAATIGDILDTFTDFGKGLTETVRSAREFGNEFINAFSVIKNIGKAALFVSIPTILRAIIAGAKTFLGIGTNLSRVLANTANQQTAFNSALQTGVGQATQEADALTRVTRELQQQVTLRNQLNQAATSAGVRTGGVTNQVNRLADLRGQPRPGLGVDQGRQNLINRTIDRTRTGFVRLTDSLTRTIGGIDSFGIRIALTAVALQGLESIGGVIENTANQLRAGGDNVKAGLLEAGNSALQTGVQFALLGGPLAGLIAAVTTGGGALAKLVIETNAQAEAAEQAVTDLGALRVAFGEVERTGSRELISAFKELSEAANSTDPNILSQALVSDAQLVGRALQALNDESSDLNEAFRQSGDVLSEVTNQVARILSESRIAERTAEVVSGLQQRFSEVSQGPGVESGPFADVAELNAKIQTEIAGQNIKLLEQEDILNKIQAAQLAIDLGQRTAAEKAELRLGSTEEILQKTQAEDDLISSLRTKRDQLASTTDEQLESLKEIVGTSEAAVRLIERLNNRQAAAVNQAKFYENIQSEVNTILTDNQVSQKEIAEIQQRIAGITQNIANSGKEQSRIDEELNKRIDDRTKQLEVAQSLVNAQAAAVRLANAELERSVRSQAEANNALQEQAETQKQIGILQLSAGNFAERTALETAKINAEKQRELSLNSRNLSQTIQLLQNSRALQQALGNQDGVAAIDAEIKKAQQLFDLQSQEIERKFSIELDTKLTQESLATLKSSELALRNFRIQQIEDVARREEEATQRRIAFLERLGDSVAGVGIVRDQGLRGTEQDVRDFGEITAAILRQFEEQAAKTSLSVRNRLDQLRVNGINTFEELNQLKEREKDLTREISELSRSGSDPQRLASARRELDLVGDSLVQIKERGIDNAQELTEVTNALAEERTIREEVLSRRREAALAQVQRAADSVNSAEKELISVRNQVPASNQKIIQSQRTVAQAEARVEQTTRSLSDANQKLADANFQLALNIGLAEFKARQAAGGFDNIQQAVNSLQNAFQNAVEESRGSFEAILNARREILQEEVSLVQSQLQAIRGLANRAFTADADQLAQLQDAASIAAGVQSGQISSQELLELPPELRQALSGLTSAFPGLQRALDEVGAGLLGIDPNTFQSLEAQLVELQTGIAETGQTQVQQAEESVQVAQQQLEEARGAKELAQQQLENSIQQKEAILANVSASAQIASATRAGFNAQLTRTNQILVQSRRGADASAKTEARQKELLNAIQKDAESAAKILGIETELAGLQKTVIAPGITETKNATKETASKVTENVRATNAVENRIAEVGGAIIRNLQDLGGFLRGLSSRVGNSAGVSSNARGSLTGAEINGVLRAASMEKRGMPTGAKLMLANTSETVLTKNQAKSFGLSARSQPNAQNGNAAIDGQAFSAIASQLGNLNNQLSQIASRAATPQQINVQLDSSRIIQVEGINNLQTSLQDIVTQRLGNTPSQAEVDAINQTVSDVIARMKESGNEDFQNL